jgi:hypothetical protein
MRIKKDRCGGRNKLRTVANEEIKIIYASFKCDISTVD